MDLNSHKGFLGLGFETIAGVGTTTPYFASPSVEVVYHEVVRMPTDNSDPTQINKKRHVGNDIVQIVWSDHVRDYSPKTISGQFGDAVIMIYPLPNGLFRIQVAKKPKVRSKFLLKSLIFLLKTPFFGPLQHGVTVPKRLLPTVVRLTVVNAYRYIRYAQEGFEKICPMMNRLALIQEIQTKFISSSLINFEDILRRTFNLEIPQDIVPATSTPSKITPSSKPNPRASDIDLKI